jgi:hypothetical protein
MYILLSMVLAPEFLHEKGVMYRDLLGRDGHVKLADYGMSRCDMPACRWTHSNLLRNTRAYGARSY